MIIDMHTHTFPAHLAARVLPVLGASENLTPFTNGTNEGLLASMEEAEVDVSVLLPVATKPEQTTKMNELAAQITLRSLQNPKCGRRLISFGAIHPDNENYKEVIDSAAEAHLPGIKLHPIFQKTDFDDPRYLRIIDYARSKGLYISVHVGLDISFPDARFSEVSRTEQVLRELGGDHLILAHMGAWKDWDGAEHLAELADEYPECYFDTSFVLSPDGRETFYETGIPAMGAERFVRCVRRIGPGRVLFGTDSPWTGQKQSIEALRGCGLTAEELAAILGENAARLLAIK